MTDENTISRQSLQADWKMALLYILNKRYLHINYTPKAKDQSSINIHLDIEANYESDYCSFTDFFRSYDDIDEARKREKISKKKHHINHFITQSVALMIEELIRLELIHVTDNSSDTGQYASTISLSIKGLETTLKLQEHDDNESRFIQQKEISETLKKNSTKSVFTARLALALSALLISIGGYRVYQLEQKILSHDAIELRISNTETELNRLKNENVLPKN